MKIDLKGVTRIVFLIGGYAIKVPNFRYEHQHFLNGCYANWNERDYYRRHFKADYKNNMAPYAAPSYFCSWFGLIQIQARCLPMKEHLTEEQINFFYPLCGTDIKKENFGWYKGKLVCLDYAK